MTEQSKWLALVQGASQNVKQARTLDADWPPNTLEQADAWLDEALAGQPGPTPTGLHGVAISYPGHSPARDLYLGYTDEQAQWGRHDGLPITAPVSGVVSLYTFTVGGAMVGLSPEAAALFEGWVCMAPPSTRPAGLQPMYVAVLVYDTPVSTPYGTVRVDWAAHVRGTVQTGRVVKDEQYAESYDSGIRFENSGVPNARAAHIHACASATGTLSPNGDLDGLAFAAVRGWTPITYLGEGGPGPTQYQAGGWTAGRRTTDFTQGGHPFPPIPS